MRDSKCAWSAGLLALVALLIASSLLLSITPVAAQTSWIGGAQAGNWFDPANWTNGVPTGTSGALIDAPGATISGAAGTTQALFVGTTGNGDLSIENGGTLQSQFGTIGAGGVGTVTVDGIGSNWNVTSILEVGETTTGKLFIQNGAKVTSASNFVGDQAGSNGTIVVDGAGSNWTASSSQIFIGESGAATVTIQNGGTFNSTTLSTLLGDSFGSSATVTVDGIGSKWTASGEIIVGNVGSASVAIRNGGVVSSDNTVLIADVSGSTGTVTIDGAGSKWTTSSNTVVAGSGTGTLTLANGGTLSATSMQIALSTGSTGTLNIGAAVGQPAVAPGTLDTPTVQFGEGTGKIVFNHTSNNYVFAPAISDAFAPITTGAGSVDVRAGTTIFTGSNTYTGPTTVNGGTLVVDGSLVSSATTINSGGTLAGTGTVGATIVANGGALSPGHDGSGTLTVNGNLAFQPGGIYRFGVSAGSAGLTNVTGTASLTGASAQAMVTGTTFATKYTILSAAGGLGGTQFASFVTNSPAVTASLSYTATDVNVNLTSAFAAVGDPASPTGLTRNQGAVARTLDTAFNAQGTGLSGLIGLSASQLPAAFDALSGEGTSATQETAFGAGNLFMTLMTDQGAFWRSGASDDPIGVTYGARPMGFAPERATTAAFDALPTKAPAPAFEQRWRGWATGFDGNWSLRGEADPGSASQRHRTGGGAAGIDYQINPNLLIGAAAGGSSSNFSVPDRATNGSLDGAHLGAYSVARWGGWYAAGTVAFSNYDNHTSRVIGVIPAEIATGHFGSNLLSGRFELGWTQRFNGFSATPFAAVQVSELWQRGYTENSFQLGGAPGGNALSFAAHNVSSLPIFLGAQFDTRLVLANDMIWSPYARLSWMHEFEPTRDITASFIALPGLAFSVDGPRAASDAARVDLGSKLAISRNAALFGSFNGEFSDRGQAYAGKGGFKVGW
jgi:T5SS/PEP-CTERM-associated repeat protein/autotransporter-associated beta strand protein